MGMEGAEGAGKKGKGSIPGKGVRSELKNPDQV